MVITDAEPDRLAPLAPPARQENQQVLVGRILRLTLLAPEIVEAILGGRQPARLQRKDLLKRFPVGWWEQRAHMFDPN